jgi:hypothetical protein
LHFGQQFFMAGFSVGLCFFLVDVHFSH